MNIPPITNIRTALKLYYTHSELGNKEIAELFGNRSTATISRLKKLVKNEMLKTDTLSYGMYKVNTPLAYKIWGIDIIDLEQRMKKLQELNLS